MSNPLNILLETRRQLVAEVEQLVAEISEKNNKLKAVDDQLFSRIQKLAEAFEGSMTPDAPETQARLFKIPLRIPGSNGKKRHGSSLSEPVESVLRALGGPLTTREIFEELSKRRVAIGGKRPIANLGAHLTHMQAIEKTEKGWALLRNSS